MQENKPTRKCVVIKYKSYFLTIIFLITALSLIETTRERDLEYFGLRLFFISFLFFFIFNAIWFLFEHQKYYLIATIISLIFFIYLSLYWGWNNWHMAWMHYILYPLALVLFGIIISVFSLFCKYVSSKFK